MRPFLGPNRRNKCPKCYIVHNPQYSCEAAKRLDDHMKKGILGIKPKFIGVDFGRTPSTSIYSIFGPKPPERDPFNVSFTKEKLTKLVQKIQDLQENTDGAGI